MPHSTASIAHYDFAAADRHAVLSSLFGVDTARAEHNVYQYANRYLNDYDGGVWSVIPLPNGGGFMQPDGDEWLMFTGEDDAACVTVSAEAAGIIITALVLSHRCFMYDRHDEEELADLFCRRHEQLLDFVSDHAERDAIYLALFGAAW